MVVLSASGGFYVSCFVCHGLPYAIVTLYGIDRGEAIQLERSACARCCAVLLVLKPPMLIGPEQILEALEVQEPMFDW